MRQRYFFSDLIMGLTLLILLFTQSGHALERENTYGFLAGMSSFNQGLSDSAGAAIDLNATGSRGAYVGVFGERYLGHSWVVVPGIYFAQKGVKFESAGTTTTKADYLETSAMLRWYFVDDVKTRIYLGAGLGFGILMGAETVSASGTTTNSSDLMAKNEISFQGGVGLELELNQDSGLIFGATYARGLSNHLNISASQGQQGLWNGFYGFVGIRFKSQKEANTPLERAREYLKAKNNVQEPASVPVPAEPQAQSQFQSQSQVEDGWEEPTVLNREPTTDGEGETGDW